MMTPPRLDVPHRFYDAMAHGDVGVPPIHQDILLTAMQKKPIADRERHGAVGPQDDMGWMQGLDGDAWHPFHFG
jgi:hypothetical protein